MKKILLVEDDAFIARIYGQKLTEAGFDVAVAEDGLVAVKRLPEFKPDIVLLDLVMPRLSGLDVLKFIRSHPGLKSTRVIVLSNTFLTRMGEEVAALGVQDMILKSAANPGLLIESIGKALQAPPAVSGPQSPPPAVPPPPPEKVESIPPRPAASIPSPPDRPSVPESASAFRKRLRRDFFEQIPSICKTFQLTSGDLLKPHQPADRPALLEAFSRKVRFLTHMSGMAGCYRISQLCSAMEALLFHLLDRPGDLTKSVRQTIESTVTLLIQWLEMADQPDEQCLSPTSVLIVDDDAVSNRALVFALSQANLKAKGVGDALQGLKWLRKVAYDVVLLDINLPGMSGLTLYEHLREIPEHKQTTVIFMTGHSEFESRARALIGPGDDFIMKPILPVELTVKVTSNVLRRRMPAQNTSSLPNSH